MLRRLTLLAVVLTVPGLAQAQSRHPRADYGSPSAGVTLSAWLGLGFPTGKFSDEGDPDVGDVMNLSVPIGFGAYVRPNPHIRLGGFFEVAPLSIDDSYCAPDESCSGTSTRLGLEGQFHASPFARYDPWFGLGFGYEWLNYHAESYDRFNDVLYVSDVKFRGLLFPRVSGGVDFNVNRIITLGPYVSYTAGQFSRVSETGFGSANIHDKAFHGWFELGIRGNFNL